MGPNGPTTGDGAHMDLGGRVSRKKDFIPPLTASMKSFDIAGVDAPKLAAVQEGADDEAPAADLGQLTIDPSDPHARIVRTVSQSRQEKARDKGDPVTPMSLLRSQVTTNSSSEEGVP